MGISRYSLGSLVGIPAGLAAGAPVRNEGKRDKEGRRAEISANAPSHGEAQLRGWRREVRVGPFVVSLIFQPSSSSSSSSSSVYFFFSLSHTVLHPPSCDV